MGEDPDTPPPTPGGPPQKGNVHQGSTYFNRATNNGGVQTGNLNGYQKIIGTLNLTVVAANTLVKNIEEFTARVDIANRRLASIKDKIAATSAVLRNINDLVEKQAKREGYPIGKERSGTTGHENGEKSGTSGSEWDQDGANSDVLKNRCVKDLMEAGERAAKYFESVSKKLQIAAEKILPPSGDEPPGRPKAVLTDARKEELSLTEQHIEVMESVIEARKAEVELTLIMYQAALGDLQYEIAKRIAMDMWKDLRWIKEFLSSRPPVQIPGQQPIFGPGQIPPPPNQLVPLYNGWIFTKGRRPNDSKASWSHAVLQKMPYSTEELFLKVIGQIANRAKHNKTLSDDCKALARSKSQTQLVNGLLREENFALQRTYSMLVWTLAGLEWTARKKKGGAKRETRRINVILKTEWAPGFGPGGPVPAGSGPVPVGSGPGGVPLRHGGYSSGSEIPVGVGGGAGYGGLQHGGGIRSGETMNAGLREQESASARPPPGAYVETPAHAPSTRRRGARSAKPKVVQHPQLVLVKKEKGKSKRRRKEDNDHRRYIGRDRRGSQYYVEFRRPGSYETRGSSSSGSSSTPSSEPPSRRPTPPRSPSPGPTGRFRPPPPPPLRPGPGAPPVPPLFVPPNVPPRPVGDQIREEEDEEIVEDMLEEWEDVVVKDRKGKQRERRTRERRPILRYQGSGDEDVGVLRGLMRQVELETRRREMEETERREAGTRMRDERMRQSPVPGRPGNRRYGEYREFEVATEYPPHVVFGAAPGPAYDWEDREFEVRRRHYGPAPAPRYPPDAVYGFAPGPASRRYDYEDRAFEVRRRHHGPPPATPSRRVNIQRDQVVVVQPPVPRPARSRRHSTRSRERTRSMQRDVRMEWRRDEI